MISCDNYDYIEIVCMYRYPIVLTLKSGDTVKGVAHDTVRNEQKKECIIFSDEDGNSKTIVLDDISKLEVAAKNPHFQEITFQAAI